MRRGILIVGAVLVVLGVILIGIGLGGGSSTVSIASGVPYGFTPNIVLPATFKVTWSGASSQTHLTIDQCTDSSCGQVASTIATGNGASGSLAVTTQPGHSYEILQTGNSQLTLTTDLSGLTFGEAIGLGLLIPGAIVAGLGVGLKPKVKEEYVSAPAAPAESEPMIYGVGPTAVPTPMTPATFGAGVGSAHSMPPAPAPATVPEVTVPEPSPAAPVGGPPPPTPTGGRPPIQCSFCGTWNEPWLTQCRWCKRPLTSTGSR